jgi:3-isopropylmalate/(R)-2-methylmalate dehydratase small subunit
MLASPAIAATSALSGKLDAPEPFETYYDSEEELVTRLKKYSQERRDVILNSEKIYYHASIKAKESEAQADAKRAWCFGDHINTDLIMPSRFCNVTDPAEYKAFVLLDSQNEEFLETYKNSEYTLKGEFIVSGANFGCGSSRESAPRGILEGGFKCVIAHSFARIFFRNAINIGLPALEIGKAAYEIKQGDKLSVNFQTGEIFNQSQNKVYQAKPMGPFQSKLFESGGLMPYLKEQIKSS